MAKLFFLLSVIYVAFADVAQNNCPNVIKRSEWNADDATVQYQTIPVEYVVVAHTVTPTCNNIIDCSARVKNIQSYHMNTRGWHDIGYNFLVGNDGNIYEGVGWHKVGIHTRGYNNRSIGLAFIGNFNDVLPDQKALDAAQQLLECGVEAGELNSRYRLVAHRQVSSTESPGRQIYQELQDWDNWVQQP